MATPNTPTREAAAVLLIMEGLSAARRLADVGERIAASLDRTTDAVRSASTAANPWAVMAGGLAIVSEVVKRTPPWGFGGAVLAIGAALAVNVAPAVAPVLAAVLSASQSVPK